MAMKKRRVLKTIKFAAEVTASIYILNIGLSLFSVSKHKLKSDPENFYQWKNGQVYYEKRGEGKPLLLIHDLHPASSAYEWNKVIEGLSKKHTDRKSVV